MYIYINLSYNYVLFLIIIIDSIYQKQWKGDVTPRSQLMLGIKNQTAPKIKFTPKLNNAMDPSEIRNEIIKVVTKYFNVFETPPNAATRDQFYERELLPKLQVLMFVYLYHVYTCVFLFLIVYKVDLYIRSICIYICIYIFILSSVFIYVFICI
jgi:hypothetical protein